MVNYSINLDNVEDAINLIGKSGEDFASILGLSEKQANELSELSESLVMMFVSWDGEGNKKQWDTEDVLKTIIRVCRDKNYNDIEALYFAFISMYEYFNMLEPVLIINPEESTDPVGWLFEGKFYFSLKDIKADKKRLRKEHPIPLYTH